MILIKITKEPREPKVGEWCETEFGDYWQYKGGLIMFDCKALSLSVILDGYHSGEGYFSLSGQSYPISNSEEIFQWLSDNGKLGEEWVEWEGNYNFYEGKVELLLPNKPNETCTCDTPLIRGIDPEYCGDCEKDLETAKEQFISKVSKINETGEDEFKAEFNSPELIWEKVIKYMLGNRH